MNSQEKKISVNLQKMEPMEIDDDSDTGELGDVRSYVRDSPEPEGQEIPYRVEEEISMEHMAPSQYRAKKTRKKTEHERQAKPFLDAIYHGEFGKIKEIPAKDVAEKIDQSFHHLEAYLGAAGRRCIDQYHLWGRKFWERDESKLFINLIKAYWHRVNAVASMRKKEMLLLPDNEKFITPITKVMIMNFTSGTREIPNQNIRKFLKIEAGHFRSLHNQIKSDTKMTCPDVDNIDESCQKGRENDDYDAWEQMVTLLIPKMIAKLDHRRQVLTLFQNFLLDPNLLYWNRLIAALVLWKYEVTFIVDNSTLFRDLPAAEKFEIFAVKSVMNDIAIEWFAGRREPNNPPKGYMVLIRLYGEEDPQLVEKQWKAINFILGSGEREPANFLEELDENFDILRGQDRHIDASVAEARMAEDLKNQRQDAAVAKARKNAEKKKKRKKKGPKEKAQARAEADEGFGGFQESLILPSAEDEVQRIRPRDLIENFDTLAKSFQTIRSAGDGSPQQINAGQDLMQSLRRGFFNQFLTAMCSMGGVVESNDIQGLIQKVKSFNDQAPVGMGGFGFPGSPQEREAPLCLLPEGNDIDQNQLVEDICLFAKRGGLDIYLVDSNDDEKIIREACEPKEQTNYNNAKLSVPAKRTLAQLQSIRRRDEAIVFGAMNNQGETLGFISVNSAKYLGKNVIILDDVSPQKLDEETLEISTVCSRGENGIASLLVLYAMAYCFDPAKWKTIIVNVPVMNDDFSVYPEGEGSGMATVAQSNVVCWYVKAFDFSMAFDPKYLSQTDHKCRSLRSVRASLQDPIYHKYDSIFIRGGQRKPDGDTSPMRFLFREYPTLEGLKAFLAEQQIGLGGRARETCTLETDEEDPNCNRLANEREELRRQRGGGVEGGKGKSEESEAGEEPPHKRSAVGIGQRRRRQSRGSESE